MMTRIAVKLKDGFKYAGEILEETETKLIIQDIKLGRLEISKDSIAVRGAYL